MEIEKYMVGLFLKLDYRPNRNLRLKVSGIHRDSVSLVGHGLYMS